jgi:hypothetical protein
MTSKCNPARWPRLLTVRDAAEYLGVGIFSVRTWVWERLLKPVPMPGVTNPRDRRMRKILLDREDLDRFVEQLKAEE